MRKHRKKPSRTRRHRESVAAKRKARAFYKMRNRRETEARTSSGRWMNRVAVLVDVLLTVAAVLAATAAWIFS